MDIQLKVFRSVAHHLSFTKASKELFMSQPAITKHIQKLEAIYRVRLFDRLGNSISLTHAGQILLKHSDAIASDYQRLCFEMNRLRQRISGDIRIGASTTIAQYELPKILANFLNLYPQTHISVLSANSREIETALIEGKIDVGMAEGTIRLPQLKYATMMNDELVAIVRTTHTLAQRDNITLNELCQQPLVLREIGSGTLDVIEKMLHQHHLTLADMNVQLYLGSTESIKRFIQYSDCMGIVSVRAVANELLQGMFKVIDIEGISMERNFVFVEKQGESVQLVNIFKRFVTSEYAGK